jgi:hypothetical protein
VPSYFDLALTGLDRKYAEFVGNEGRATRRIEPLESSTRARD